MSTINQDGDFNEVICEFRFELILLLSIIVHNIWDVSAIARLSATDMYCDLDIFYKLMSAKQLHCSAIVCVSYSFRFLFAGGSLKNSGAAGDWLMNKSAEDGGRWKRW